MIKYIFILFLMLNTSLVAHINPIYRNNNNDDPCEYPCCTKFAQPGDIPVVEYNCLHENIKCNFYCGLCCTCYNEADIPVTVNLNCGTYLCNTIVDACRFIGPGQGISTCKHQYDKTTECSSSCGFSCDINYAICKKPHEYTLCDCVRLVFIATQWNPVNPPCF